MPKSSQKNEKYYKFYICVDPLKNGLLCEVKIDPGSLLIDVVSRAVGELVLTYSEWISGVTKDSISEWLFLHGELGGYIELLDPQRTLHDLAIFPMETLYMGPRRCFERWLTPQ